MLERLIPILINAVWAVVEIIIGFMLGPRVKILIEKLDNKAVDQGVMTFLGSLANIAIKILAVVIAISQMGVNLNVVVGMFSAVGLGISPALQNNMANLAGGVQILLTKPFVIGDLISVEGLDGTVQRIELMFTILQTFDRQEIVIPNSDLVSKPIINYTLDPNRRIVITVEVASDYDPAEFKSEVEKIVAAHENVLQDPPSSVVTTAINPNSYTVTVYAYTLVTDYWNTLCELNQSILEKRLAMKVPQPYKSYLPVDTQSKAQL